MYVFMIMIVSTVMNVFSFGSFRGPSAMKNSPNYKDKDSQPARNPSPRKTQANQTEVSREGHQPVKKEIKSSVSSSTANVILFRRRNSKTKSEEPNKHNDVNLNASKSP